MQRATFRQHRAGMAQGGLPTGDHRQRIREIDPVENRDAESLCRAEIERVSLRNPDSVAEAAPDNASSGAFQHLVRDVEAKEPRLRITLGCHDEVTSGAAAGFQNGSAWRHIEIGNELVAAEKIVSAAGIVDMALQPVHAVHRIALISVDQAKFSVTVQVHRHENHHRSPNGRWRQVPPNALRDNAIARACRH